MFGKISFILVAKTHVELGVGIPQEMMTLGVLVLLGGLGVGASCSVPSGKPKGGDSYDLTEGWKDHIM